jgi:hypothetical protein
MENWIGLREAGASDDGNRVQINLHYIHATWPINLPFQK